jgi:hypothetical protein
MIRKRGFFLILICSFLLSFSINAKAKENQRNHNPVINAIYASKEVVSIGESVEIIVKADDLDKDKLNYQWLVEGGQIIEKGERITYFPPNVGGSYKITAIVTDNQGGSALASTKIDVINLDLSLELERTSIRPGETIEVTAHTRNFEGKLNYRWLTGYGSISGQGNKVTYTAPDKEGLYNIRVSIRDSRDIEVRNSITVEVRNYLPKVINSLVAKPKFITIDDKDKEGKATLSLSAVDFNGDELTYLWSAKEGKIIGQGERVTYISPTYSVTDTVEVRICDSYGGEIVERIDINVIKVWQRSYGGIGCDAFEAITNRDDGYLAVGYTTSFNKDWVYPSGYLVGIDENGKELFYNYDFFAGKEDLFFTISPSNDGNYLLGGYKGNSKNLSNDGYIVKVDKKDGKKLAEYRVNDTNSNQQIYKLYLANNGGYLAIGHSNKIGNDGYLAKLKNNDKLSEYTYNYDNNIGSNDYFNDIIASADGRYLLAGHTSLFDNRDGDGLLVKLDIKGKEVFEHTYGREGLDERFERIIGTEDGGYLLVGVSGSTKSWLYDGYIVKVDSQGEIIFSYTYGAENSDEGFRAVAPVDDGGYLLAGYSNSANNGDYDGYLVKIDNHGQQEWSKVYGGIENDEFMDITVSNDGGYLLVGYTNSFAKGERDAYIVKIDKEGRTGPDPDNYN